MRLLVNAPTGKQELIEIGEGGGYFDISRVLWDERVDGHLPEITVGGMVRDESGLVFDQARMDAHTAVNSPTSEQLKAIKLTAVNAECDRRMSLLVTGYPEREQQTFDKQESEARAFTANASAATPMIDALVANRGIDKAELVTRIITKADLFAQYSGAVIGNRQRLEDLLTAATALEQVQAVDISAGWPA